MDLKSREFAHDLKVPVQLIASCIQLLEDEICENARAEAYLRTLARSAGQLQDMITHALEADMLRAGMRDIVADARTLAREFELLAKRKSVRVHFTSNTSKFSIRTDGEKQRRILHNLMANALRFTPPGGKIWLKLWVFGDAVELSVTDSGCGIPPENQARIFESGFTTGGSGHGLAICKSYAGLLGGSLRVQSTPGLGSSFTLRLPLPVEN